MNKNKRSWRSIAVFQKKSQAFVFRFLLSWVLLIELYKMFLQYSRWNSLGENYSPFTCHPPPHPPTAWSWTDQTADSDSTQVTQPWAKLCLSFLIWKMAQKQELDQRTVKIKSHVKSTGNYLHYGSPVAGTITIIGALISALITPPSITAMFLQQNAVGLSTLPSTV